MAANQGSVVTSAALVWEPVEVRQGPYLRWGKRALDLVLAVCLVHIFSVPAVSIAFVNCILYRRIFFIQTRVGKQGRTFEMLKFISMKDGKETAFGKFLRYTALDELPQILHVLRGEMSLVGPRPHTVEQVERLSELVGYSVRFAVSPGMTGLAQLRRAYDEDGLRDRLIRSDREYVEQRTLGLDLLILIRTLAVFFTGH